MTTHSIKKLSIQVSLNGLSFCILNTASNTIVFLKTITFEQKLTPFNVLNHLKTEINTNTIFSENFSSVTVIHQNDLSTIVPKALYNKNHNADYLKFNSKILRTDFITQDAILINNSVTVYIPYVNINNYIYETFGDFTYKHSSSVLIESVLQKNKYNQNPEVYINVNTNTFELIVADKDQLLLFNVFHYQSKEDFIYYILFVFEQLKLNTETTQVTLSGLIHKTDELYSSLYTYVRHVKCNNTSFSYKFANTIDSESIQHNYLILNSF